MLRKCVKIALDGEKRQNRVKSAVDLRIKCLLKRQTVSERRSYALILCAALLYKNSQLIGIRNSHEAKCFLSIIICCMPFKSFVTNQKKKKLIVLDTATPCSNPVTYHPNVEQCSQTKKRDKHCVNLIPNEGRY